MGTVREMCPASFSGQGGEPNSVSTLGDTHTISPLCLYLGGAVMLGGIEVQVSKYLPDTVKDKDGKDVKLLGVMIDPNYFSLFPDDRMSRPPIVFLTEESAETMDLARRAVQHQRNATEADRERWARQVAKDVGGLND
jgi:hypothetical protein